jgi:hypothetical protein
MGRGKRGKRKKSREITEGPQVGRGKRGKRKKSREIMEGL